MSYRIFPATTLFIACMAFAAPDASSAQIDATQLSGIVKVLASDEFEGRAPGTPGEEKTPDCTVDPHPGAATGQFKV
jgi:hypothetical protein